MGRTGRPYTDRWTSEGRERREESKERRAAPVVESGRLKGCRFPERSRTRRCSEELDVRWFAWVGEGMGGVWGAQWM